MKKSFLIFTVLFFVLWGCSDKGTDNSVSYTDAYSEEYDYYNDDVSSYELSKDYYQEDVLDGATPPSGGQDPVVNTATSTDQTAITPEELDDIGRKIIRNGDVSIELTDYEKSLKLIKDTLKNFDCEISNESENNYSSYITNTIVIRVKASQFDSLLAAVLSGNGKIVSKNIYSNDVTQQYVDIFIRLKNKKAVLDRYRSILARANTINEVLSVEQYIRQIEEEIETAEGQLLYWDDQSSYSTLTLTLTYYGEQTPVARDSFWTKLLEGLEMGWNGVLYFILGLVTLWPLWILIGIIIFVVSRQIKKIRAKNSTKN